MPRAIQIVCVLALGATVGSAVPPASATLSVPSAPSGTTAIGPIASGRIPTVEFGVPRLLNGLTAQWWQWALSIPAASNPLSDTTGQYCMIGQRGPVWLLAGTFDGGKTERTCALPEKRVLLVPVANSVQIDAPGVCGSEPKPIPVAQLRANAAGIMDSFTKLSVQLDGRPITSFRRVRSVVFEVALPERNLFDAPCSSAGGVPAGIYAPAVDDGYYVILPALSPGRHRLRIRAENPVPSLVQDVLYRLNVVPDGLP